MKPLNQKSYGSIAHLPISKLGQGDKRVHFGQAVICLEKLRDKNDEIIVQEKLDGSCVCVARQGDDVIALGRAGYLASSSSYEQHQKFDQWVQENRERFLRCLNDGERIVGEWLYQAHGTKYLLKHEPFVAFDIMDGTSRISFDQFCERTKEFITPNLYHRGPPLPLHHLIEKLKISGHGADEVEGAIYRVQRFGEIDFLAKFVRPDYVTGKYLEVYGHEPLFNLVSP